MPEQPSLSTPRASIINRAAVKAYALKVAKERRAGKFTRVSAEFLDSVQANLEALIREVAQGYCMEGDVSPDIGADWFINGKAMKSVEPKLNEAARKIVVAKVRSHPSVGCTLK